MRMRGAKTLRLAGRWLRSRWQHGTLILGYHRVAKIRHDPFDMCVSPHHFAQQLAILAKRAEVVRLADCQITTGKPQVVLTFDDGYVDFTENVLPLLRQWEMPASLFIATGNMGEGFWWDKLVEWVLMPALLPTHLHLTIQNQPFHWQQQTSSRSQLCHQLYQQLLPLSPSQRNPIMAEIKAWSAPDAKTGTRTLTPAEIKALGNESLINIGAHSVNHPQLTTLSTTDQQAEIEQSKQCLEQILVKPVTTFSYPNGSYNVHTQQLLAECGFKQACTSDNNLTYAHNHPLGLPRFWMGDWTGKQFEQWLQRWLR